MAPVKSTSVPRGGDGLLLTILGRSFLSCLFFVRPRGPSPHVKYCLNTSRVVITSSAAPFASCFVFVYRGHVVLFCCGIVITSLGKKKRELVIFLSLSQRCIASPSWIWHHGKHITWWNLVWRLVEKFLYISRKNRWLLCFRHLSERKSFFAWRFTHKQ